MRIITARPHRLLPAVIAEIGALAQQGQRCMLLVPSQYTLQAEIEVMEQLEIEGSFLIDVLSPGRLQKRVFERAGMPDRVVFDDRGKIMVLAEIIEAEKENLTVYRSTAESGQQGFASRMAALIADLKRSGARPRRGSWRTARGSMRPMSSGWPARSATRRMYRRRCSAACRDRA